MVGDLDQNYAIIAGGRGWLIPRETISEYSLQLKLKGSAWNHSYDEAHLNVLVTIPTTAIVLRNETEQGAAANP